MKKTSPVLLLTAACALCFTTLGNVSYAGKTKEEKKVARAERLLEAAEKADDKADDKRKKAETIIVELEKAEGINPDGNGSGGETVMDSPFCGGPGQPLC